MKKFIITTGTLFLTLSTKSGAIESFASGLENIVDTKKAHKMVQPITNTLDLIEQFSKIDEDFTEILKNHTLLQEFLLKNENVRKMLLESQIIRSFFDEDNSAIIIKMLLASQNTQKLETFIKRYNTFKNFPAQLSNFNQSWPFSDNNDEDEE